MPKPPPLQPLAHPVGVLYEIRWSEICPWLILVKALRVTLLIRVLVLALVGVLLTQWGSAAIDGFFSTESPALTLLSSEAAAATPRLPVSADHPANSMVTHAATGPLLRGWHWACEPFSQIVNYGVTWRATMILLVQGGWFIVVWAVFGGAIARIAALYLTREETLGPVAATQHALTTWPSTAGAPLIALLGGTALAVPLGLVGFLLRLELFAIVAGLLWGLILAWGLMLAVVLIGLWLGWPLMWACQAVERSDAFDGVSRGYAYVYQKPLQLAFYILVATLLALVGEAVIHVFAAGAVSLAEWTLSWGAGGERTAQLFAINNGETPAALSTRAIAAWKSGVATLVESFPMACLWSYAVGIYLLMRRHVDSTEMDEVTLADGSKQAGPPKLKETDSGVPEVERPTANGHATE